METYTNTNPTPTAKRITFLLLVLGYVLQLSAQQNLIVNGNLSEFQVDSIAVEKHLYYTEKVGAQLNNWEKLNSCQAYYNPAYSRSKNVFLMATLYERLGPHDAGVFNIIGELRNPLTAGKKYYLSFYVKPFSGTAITESIDVLFTDTIIVNKTFFEDGADKHRAVIPDVRKTILVRAIDSFYHVHFIYTAKGAEKYISIGNFSSGKPRSWKKTPHYGIQKRTFKYQDWCKYALSELILVPIDTSEVTRDSSRQFFLNRSTIKLPVLFYESNAYKTEIALDSIIEICREHPNMALFIIGHTDNEGTAEYNIVLSKKRAETIANLLLHKIQNKIVTTGVGSSAPLENKSPSWLNRRVEMILKDQLDEE